MTGETLETWYLEHTDGHYKFYEIKIVKDDNPPKPLEGRAVQNHAIMYRHGRIGSPGRQGEHNRANEILGAQHFVNNLLNEKQAKGYVLKAHVKGALNPAAASVAAKSSSAMSKRFGRIIL